MRGFDEACAPPLWARGAHAQTLLGHALANSAPRPSAWPAREVELSDGDRVVVHAHAGSSGVRALVWHGLTGDVDSTAARRVAGALARAGHDVWAVNHRGCGRGEGLAAQPYHSGAIHDLADVLRASRAERPQFLQVVVGLSISGNIALLHAARDPKSCADATLAVNPPVDLADAARALHDGFQRVYELYFVARLRRKARALLSRGRVVARGPLQRFASIVEFDHAFTAPAAGFTSASEYYARCSAGPELQRIASPAVILTSEDDPMARCAALRGFELSRSTHLHVERLGGHLGYVSTSHGWLERAVVHYVGELARVTVARPSVHESGGT
jgi:hypothetical protein